MAPSLIRARELALTSCLPIAIPAIALAILLAVPAIAAGRAAPDPRPEPQVSLPREGEPAFRLRLDLDPAKVTPEPMAIMLGWYGDEEGCGFLLEPSIVSLAVEEAEPVTEDQAGRIKPADGSRTLERAKGSGDTAYELYHIMLTRAPAGSTPETLLIQFTRHGGNANDTCDGPLHITNTVFDYRPPSSTTPRALRTWALGSHRERPNPTKAKWDPPMGANRKSN